MTKQTINIGIPTLHCYSQLLRLCSVLASDYHSSIVPQITIIDNGGKLLGSKWEGWLNELPVAIGYIRPSSNLGVAASWNMLLKELSNCIIANDDAVFSLGDVQAFQDAAQLSPETIIFNAAAIGHHWSLFFVNQAEQWLTMGGFDETFFPAYFEDNDANRRLDLVCNPCKFVELRDFRHDQSSTLKHGDTEYQRNHYAAFHRNAQHYQEKWGGVPGQEQYLVPFDGRKQ